MGTYVDVRAQVTFPKSTIGDAEKAAKGYLTSSAVRYGDWLQKYLEEKPETTLQEILEQIGWQTKDNKGDLLIVGQLDLLKYDNRIFEDLFEKLAPYIADGSRVLFNADGEMWCWVFQGGKLYRDELVPIPASAAARLEDPWGAVVREAK